MATAEAATRLVEVPLALIDDSPYQPRTEYEEGPLLELAASIMAVGIITPLCVRQRGERYELIGGHRRKRASELAGRETVSCVIRTCDDDEARRLALLDNLNREDLPPWDEGAGYRNLMDGARMSVAEIAAEVGKSEGFIRGRMELAASAGEVLRAAYVRDDITLEAMQAACKLPDEELEIKPCPRCSAVCRGSAKVCGACTQDLSLTFPFPIGNPQEVAAKVLKGVPSWGIAAAIARVKESYALAEKPVQANMGIFGVEAEQISAEAAASKTTLDRLCDNVARLEAWWLKNAACIHEYSTDQLETTAAKCRVIEKVAARIRVAVEERIAAKQT